MTPFAKLAVSNLLNNQSVIRFQTSGRAVRTNGQITGWAPVGSCGLNSEPSTTCTGFGRIRSDLDYQTPRQVQVSLGLQF